MSETARFSVIQVPFSGNSRVSRLTWAQQAMWSCLEFLGEQSHYFNLATVVPVPDSCVNEDVARAVAALAGRHEVLRTRFACRDGEPRQEVSASGTLTLRVFNVDDPPWPPGDDGKHAIDYLVAALRSLPFDHAAEWPLRCALLCAGGAPRYLGLVFSHLAADGTGISVCAREVAQSLAGTQAGASAAPPWQAADQALHEDGPPGHRASRRAVAHWRAQLAMVPVPLFPACREPAAEPRIWHIALESQAVAAAGLVLARRAQTSFATIMLAGCTAMLAAFTGNQAAALVLTAGNRVSEQARSSAVMMAQDTLMVLPVDGAGFAEIVERVSAASLRAYFAGHYDPALVKQVRAAVARERGLAAVDISAYFNDHAPGPEWAGTVARDVTSGLLDTLKARSAPLTVSAWPRQDSTLFLHSRYAPGRSVLHAVTDTAHFPLTEARAFLRGVEELITRAALAPVGPAGIGEIAAAARRAAADRAA